MKLRLRADLILDIANRTELEALRDQMLPVFQHSENVNEGLGNEELSWIEVQECHHDEDPPQPCVVLAKWIKGKGKVI